MTHGSVCNDRHVSSTEAPTAGGVVDASAPGTGPHGPVPVGRWAYRAGLVVLGLQFVALIVLSVVTYRRYTLGIDFAIFNQAWSQIGTGHLDPMSTLHGYPFIESHFELLMWPLALLHPLVHSSFVLLVVQDVALVGTEVVTFTWVAALVRRSGLSTAWTAALLAGTLAVLVATPGLYTTVVEDFHFEAVATFFVVFAAYDLWSGRTRRLWVWVVLALLCGDVAGLYVLAVGLSGVVVRGRRREGLALVVVGVAWVGLITVLGDNQGSNFATGYAYLAGRTSLPGGLHGLALVAGGLATHPGRAVHLASHRVGTAVRYVLNGGAIGVASPWGFFVPLVVLGTSILQYEGVFIGLPFQNYVVVPFVAFGSVWFVVWVATRWRTRYRTALAVTAAVAALLIGVGSSAQRWPTALDFNASHGFVPGPTAAALGQVLARTPSDAEVAAPLATVGRFGQRPFVYVLVHQAGGPDPPIPVSARTVVVVVDPDIAPLLLSPTSSAGLVRDLERQGARVLVSSSGVTALLWHPSAGVTSFRIP